MMFHFILSVSPAFGVVDFTAVLFPLFLLFLPEAELATAVGRILWVGRRSAVVGHLRRHPRAFAILAVAVLGFGGYVLAGPVSSLLYICVEAYFAALLVAVLLAWLPRPAARSFGRPLLVHIPVALLVLAWAASPYLGLRTTGVFTMFSSLHTEGTYANHLFIPTHHVVSWQDDLAVIDTANTPDLAGVAPGTVGVPLIELRRLAETNRALSVTGTCHGEHVVWGPGEGQTHFAPLPWWERKFVAFRPIGLTETSYCSSG